MDDQKLKSLVEAEREWIIAKRRELHRVPENEFYWNVFRLSGIDSISLEK